MLALDSVRWRATRRHLLVLVGHGNDGDGSQMALHDFDHEDGESMESTASLLLRARAGDEQARNALLCRYQQVLCRWAHGRLPRRARDLLETDDLVQDTLIRALRNLDHFTPRGEGSFLAYLRTMLLNQIREEIRRTGRRKRLQLSAEDLQAAGPSPLDQAITAETFERYEAALNNLEPQTREAVLLWLEFGYTHGQIAAAGGGPSENAVRMRVARALAQIAKDMSATRR